VRVVWRIQCLVRSPFHQFYSRNMLTRLSRLLRGENLKCSRLSTMAEGPTSVQQEADDIHQLLGTVGPHFVWNGGDVCLENWMMHIMHICFLCQAGIMEWHFQLPSDENQHRRCAPLPCSNRHKIEDRNTKNTKVPFPTQLPFISVFRP
jgi:hypothetical protein